MYGGVADSCVMRTRIQGSRIEDAIGIIPGYSGPRIFGLGNMAGTAGKLGGVTGGATATVGSEVKEPTAGGGGSVLYETFVGTV